MTSYLKKPTLPYKYKRLEKLKGLLQKRGNKERIHTMLKSLYISLKQGLHGQSGYSNYPLNTLDEKTPLALINKCLYNIMPAFALKRAFKAGKLYLIPTPISENRAWFIASDWLRKAAFKFNKNDLHASSLLTREIGATLHKAGSSKDYLKEYIDIGLDNRPFTHFIRRRRKLISRTRGTRIGDKLYKIYRLGRHQIYKQRGQSFPINRKINRHYKRRYVSARINKRKRLNSQRLPKKKKLKLSKRFVRYKNLNKKVKSTKSKYKWNVPRMNQP